MALRGIPRLASLPTAIGNWAEQLDKAAPGVLPWLQDFFASVFREFKDLRSRVGALESASVATTNTTTYTSTGAFTHTWSANAVGAWVTVVAGGGGGEHAGDPADREHAHLRAAVEVAHAVVQHGAGPQEGGVDPGQLLAGPLEIPRPVAAR